MDLAPSRLAEIRTLDPLLEEAGVHIPLKGGVLGALGRPITVRKVAFVSDVDWQELAATLPLSQAFTPVQSSRLCFLQHVAKLTAGLRVERGSPAAGASAAPPPPSKRVKLSSLVDPSAEAELDNLPSLAPSVLLLQ